MSTPTYLTVNQAAELLGMTPGGVRKAITDGRLRAMKRSERKTLVPRTAIEAYQARLNGGGPIYPERPRIAPLATRVEEFAHHTGLDPAEWLRRWRAEPDRDTAEGMRIAIAALAIEVERQPDGDEDDARHPFAAEPLPAFALAAFTTLNGK